MFERFRKEWKIYKFIKRSQIEYGESSFHMDCFVASADNIRLNVIVWSDGTIDVDGVGIETRIVRFCIIRFCIGKLEELKRIVEQEEKIKNDKEFEEVINKIGTK